MKRLKAIGVTGTPGTGKKSVSAELALLLKKRHVDINSLARARWPVEKDGEVAVDVKELRRDLGPAAGGAVVSGHLLSELVNGRDAEFVAVLRCRPTVLKRRLLSRGYPGGKVVENVEAELIGVVLDAALRRFGRAKVHEYDTSRTTPGALARRIARDYRSGLPQEGRWIDWTLLYDSPTKLRSVLAVARTEPAST